MPPRLIRSILPVLAMVLSLAGCGGSSQATHAAKGGAALSSTAYHAKVDAAIAPWEQAVSGLRRHIAPSALRAVASTATTAATAVSGLRPPAVVARLQPQLVAVLKQNAGHAEHWATALQSHDTAAAKRYAHEFQKDGHKILAIDQAYRRQGVTL